MITTTGARPDEVMTISASRLLEDDKVMFAGIGQPLLAAGLARRRQAPGLTVILEGGMIGVQLLPGEFPASTNEMRAAVGAEMLTSATDIFLMAQRGFFDYGFIGVGQIDRYGNVNTSLIGAHDQPSVRLPGPGGANDIASMCNQTLIVTSHEPRRFVERVDYITSPGYLEGGNSRAEAGLLHGGPSFVVTDLALMDFEPESRRMRLRGLQPGVSVEDVQNATGFQLLVAEELDALDPVNAEELAILRQLTGRV
ncbi:CoA-transferase subunit beta [Segeticoccus rhizosphaerae]|uniref:CoA-transferase subunit beta n=1 Tax=Segeticoccus rhizosphaerae TaxID=1104777 RepID=UPI00192E6124|nr:MULTISPECIES: CoA-transferase [Intrasporangiaceae]